MADQYKDHKPGLAILNDVYDFSCRFLTIVHGPQNDCSFVYNSILLERVKAKTSLSDFSHPGN